MIGRGLRIGRVLHCRLLDLRHWYGDQVLCAGDVGLAASAGQQPVVADAMEPLRQNMEQEAPDELVGARRHPERLSWGELAASFPICAAWNA